MPIINQVVKGSGGGSAPTYYIQRNIDANGTLVKTGSLTVMNFQGVKSISAYSLYYAFEGNKDINQPINMPDLISFGSNSSGYCFANTAITELNAPKLKYVEQYGADHIVAGSDVVTVDFSALEEIVGSFGLQNFANGCRYLSKVKMGKLTQVAVRGLQQGLVNCIALTSVGGANDSVDISSLENLSAQLACSNLFQGCTGIIQARFLSLNDISGQNSMYQMLYNCTALQSVWFFALNTNSFGSRTDHFNNTLQGCTNVTVHFPMAIQSTISSWTYITNGLGGTNTTVLYDIVTSLTGADTNTYTRSEKNSTATATAWVYNDTLYYTAGVSDNTNGVNEPTVSDAIYSDAACTQSVTTITAIA